MSDIVIPNMEMPTDKQYSLTIFPDGRVIQHWEGVVFGETKAIELPQHGDLKDYDLLEKKMLKRYEDNKKKWDISFIDGFLTALKMLDKAPTILEASKEESK